MAIRLELTICSMEGSRLATFYVEPQLLAVHSFEDTVSGPGIQLGEKPHRLSVCRNRNRDPSFALLAVVVRVSECERCRQTLPPCKVNFVLGFDAGHKRRLTAIGDGCVNFLRLVPDRQQLITIQGNPSACVTLPVQR